MAVPVRINREGRIVDADRVVKIRFSRHEDVLWIAQDNGGPWTITFENGSPFSQNTYSVPMGGSGGSTGGPSPGSKGKAYRYTVKGANGNTDEGEVDVIDDSPKTHNVTRFNGTTTSR
jgi:hypothetical protein